MEKEVVSNIASVGILFRANDPRQIFIEVKDDGYPMKLFRRCLCPIGGNWIGEAGKPDKNPLGTFKRELNEEISLERAAASTFELNLLGFKPESSFYLTPSAGVMPSGEEVKILAEFKEYAASFCCPFGDFIHAIPTEIIRKAEPESKRDGFKPLVSYWLVPLPEKLWQKLTYLQQKFGNLSNESITVITSLEEIIASGMKTAFGHDRVLQKFFLSFGFQEARHLPILDGIESRNVGNTLASYADYTQKYEILRKPAGV